MPKKALTTFEREMHDPAFREQFNEEYREFWYGIDASKFPYLRKLRNFLLKSSDTITLSELDIDKQVGAPVTDSMYVQLHLHRMIPERI